MFWVSLGSVPPIGFVLGVVCVVLWRKLNTAQHALREASRTEILTLHHLDRLIRHFHLNTPSPYVVETFPVGSGINERHVHCWHCKTLRADGHQPSCPWAYVHRVIRYSDNGTPTLRA